MLCRGPLLRFGLVVCVLRSKNEIAKALGVPGFTSAAVDLPPPVPAAPRMSRDEALAAVKQLPAAVLPLEVPGGESQWGPWAGRPRGRAGVGPGDSTQTGAGGDWVWCGLGLGKGWGGGRGRCSREAVL